MSNKNRDTDLHILFIVLIMGFVNFKVASIFLALIIIYYLIKLFNGGITIAKRIEEYKSKKILLGIHKFNVLIKENIVMFTLVSMLTISLVCLWQFNILPSNVRDNDHKEVHATFGNKETYAINKTVYFDDIGVDVSLISVSKTDFGALLELTISNQSNLSIKPTLFKFSIIDNNHGKTYDVVFENYDIVKQGDKKTYVFNIEELSSNCDDITLNIEYDDFIEYRLVEKLDIDLS